MRAPLVLAISVALAVAACGKQQAPAPAPQQKPAPQQQAATPAPPPVPADATAVRGQIIIDGLAGVPRNLQLRLRILDMSDPSIVPPVVAERIEPAPAQLPYKYALPYDPATIREDGKYVAEAALVTGDVVLYGTPSPMPVLTQGAGADAVLALARGGGLPPPDMAPADLLKQDFDKLKGMIGGMRRLQGERVEEDVTVGWDAFADNSGVRFVREAIDYGAAGTASFEFAYKSGQPWVVSRSQKGITTLVGWGDDGSVVLNRQGKDGQASDAEVGTLRKHAEAVYATASSKR